MPQVDPVEVGARIARARHEVAMTQEQLADGLDLSVRQVQNIEAGTYVPWKHFSRLEAILDRPLSWFLHGQDQVRPVALTELMIRLEALELNVARLTVLLERVRAT